MDALETPLKPIRRSPLLVEASRLLNQQIERERRQREQLYEKMSPDEKVEFIDGEKLSSTRPPEKIILMLQDVFSHCCTRT